MLKYCRLGLSISFIISLTQILAPVAIAEGIPQRWAAKRYKVPTVGRPMRREAAATRGACPLHSPIAIVPRDAFTATTAAYPTLFFNVPSIASSSSLPVKFILLDGKQTVYQTKFQLTGNRRTIGISLPSTGDLAPLKLDHDYRWLFIVQCTNDQDPSNLSLTGMIRRVVPDATLAAKLKTFSPPESTATKSSQLPSIYAEAEIWQDALMQLVELRRLDPQNPELLVLWKSLLKSVDLDAVVNDPLDP